MSRLLSLAVVFTGAVLVVVGLYQHVAYADADDCTTIIKKYGQGAPAITPCFTLDCPMDGDCEVKTYASEYSYCWCSNLALPEECHPMLDSRGQEACVPLCSAPGSCLDGTWFDLGDGWSQYVCGACQ